MGRTLPTVGAMIELTNTQWVLVEDLFDPQDRRGAPARDPRRLRARA